MTLRNSENDLHKRSIQYSVMNNMVKTTTLMIGGSHNASFQLARAVEDKQLTCYYKQLT